MLASSLHEANPQAQTAQPASERLTLPRFSRNRPTHLEAVAELFAELKHDCGEFIWFDDLPMSRNDQGAECVVLVRTIHFVTLLVSAKNSVAGTPLF